MGESTIFIVNNMNIAGHIEFGKGIPYKPELPQNNDTKQANRTAKKWNKDKKNQAESSIGTSK